MVKYLKKELRKIEKFDVEINEKMFKRLFIIGIIFIILYMFGSFMLLSLPRIYHLDKNTVLDTENSIENGINNLYRGSLRLEVSGWAYKKGQAVKTYTSTFILKNKENDKMYSLRTGMKQVEELQFVDGHECLNCGMETQSIILGLQNGAYELLILYKNDGENLLVDTGVEVDL